MNREDCIRILQKAGCEQEVIDHSVVVADLALEICERRFRGVADSRLVEAGALLHDIGRSRTHRIDHGVVGARIAKELGLDPRLVLIIERHIGAGITQEEAKELGLPPKDYIPETIEEKIVAHADNLVDDTRRITIEERIRMVKERLTDSHVQRMLKLHDDVCGKIPSLEILWGTAEIRDVNSLMRKISKISKERGVVIQLVDGELVAGVEHVKSAVKKAIRSMREGEQIASNPALEILLYMSGTRNISRALEMGVKEGKGVVCLVLLGDNIDESLKQQIFELLSFEPHGVPGYDDERKARLMDFFEITETELGAVGEDKLEKLVMERVALLEVLK
ncbi:MAG TPA: TIGR00295 family protein [Candidatus Syntrophoarchaeum butanivorans]|uniref:TIGR00295 family protein n=1 Tax=Candidatus Syntropharchaeum butanivorans TaxID=1839936 RepID=A0A7C0X1L4_9EURY|nr:TIGR00295 family protein [Candidatus Syntrophoarchaeum butanivorans]